MSQSDFVTRGQALVCAGQFQEAVKVCRLGLLGRPTTVEGRVVLGRALMALKRYDEVLAEMRVALELDQHSVTAQVLQGEALLRKSDPQAALEVLTRVRMQAPDEPGLASLVADATRQLGRPTTGRSMSFVAGNDEATRHYPNHRVEEDTEDDGLDTGDGGYEPPGRHVLQKRTRPPSRPAAMLPAVTPPPAVLAIGDRSGTVEVDPELDGVELDADFDEVVAPPPHGFAGARHLPLPVSVARRPSILELADDEVIELDEIEDEAESGATAVRDPGSLGSQKPAGVGAIPILPTIIGTPPPARAASSLNLSQQQSAALVDLALFGDATSEPDNDPPQRAARAAAGRVEESSVRRGIDDRASGVTIEKPVRSPTPAIRKPRSRRAIVAWVLIGAVAIGGGVFVGFRIRAMRLRDEIAARRDEAAALAKADTWKGWIGARDRLSGIAQASSTAEHVAAFVRARSLIAYEFGDGVAEAAAGLEAIATLPGFDREISAGYLALARNDARAARAAGERARALAPDDPAAFYVIGQGWLVAGDTAHAIESLKAAADREQRPIYAAGLARAYAEASAWNDARNVLDNALAASPDHPGLLIERGRLLAASGQITPSLGGELRARLEAILGEGARPANEQSRGVSPAQLGFANLALAQIDFLRGDSAAAQADVRAALSVSIDDQRFAERAIDTLYAIGELGGARAAAELALTKWPASWRARLAMTRIALAHAKPSDAIAIVASMPDLEQIASALAVRAQIRAALGELEAARKDFDAALGKAPGLESAVVGRTWLDLANHEIAAARRRIEPVHATSRTAAVATAYAAVLRVVDEPGALDKAKSILERVVAGPPSPELGRAQLELARSYRDAGDPRAARTYADASRTGSLDARLETALLLIESRDPIGGRETLDQLLDAIPATDRPVSWLLEAARAHVLVGDHAGGAELLDRADRARSDRPGDASPRWQSDRERGRLALRKGDYPGAAEPLARALESCGDDVETFLLAAEVAAADDKQAALGARVTQLVGERIKDRAEAYIVKAKLVAKGDEAKRLYDTANRMLEVAHATPRRLAQVQLGRAIVAYDQRDDAAALAALDLAIGLDPALYEAYLYYADVAKDNDPKQALAKAQLAIKFNPDLADGHQMVGTLAYRLGDRALLAASIAKLAAIAPNGDAIKALRRLR